MSDIFEKASQRYRGSPSVIVLFILAVFMFAIGANHLVEDTVSSKIGLETLQKDYELNVQIFQWSYWTMSLAPQVASMVFMYLFLSDTSKKWSLLASLASQAADQFADTWYRSNGKLFDDPMVFLISYLLTLVYYTIGSEFFLTVGGGLILKLFAPALQTWRTVMENIEKAGRGSYSPEPKKEPNKGLTSQSTFNRDRTEKLKTNPNLQRFMESNKKDNQKDNHKNGDTEPVYFPRR